MRLRKIKNTAMQIGVCTAMVFALGLSACYASEGPEQSSPAVWKYGTDVDVLPYAMRGYYGSAFVGHDGWKFRAVVARSTIPSFLVADGFKEKRTDAYALLADRFFGSRRQRLEGFWVGGGGEFWRNRIRTDASPEIAHYNNVMLTAGGGYAWKISRHLYVNPWTGVHLVASGARNIQVSGRTYKQPVFTPQGSVKFGFTF